MSVTKETMIDKIKKNQTPESLPQTFAGLNSNGISKLLDLYKGQISMAIPRHIKADRVLSIATTILNRTPELKECSAPTILGAIMQSAVLGLDPTPGIDECYFIPRKNNKLGIKECQFMIGYRGYISLAMNTGDIQSVQAHVVYENDEFEYEYGLEPNLIHKPTKDDPGEMTHAYAVWKFQNGGYYFEVMNKRQILAAKKSSPASASQYSPWNTPDGEPEMWRKTVVRRSRKYVPMSTEKVKSMMRSIASDEAVIRSDDFDNVISDLDDPNRIEHSDNKKNSAETEQTTNSDGVKIPQGGNEKDKSETKQNEMPLK